MQSSNSFMCVHTLRARPIFRGHLFFFRECQVEEIISNRGRTIPKQMLFFLFYFQIQRQIATSVQVDRGLLFPFTTEGTVQIHDQIISDFPDSSFATNYHLHMIEQSFFLKAPQITYLQNLYKYFYLDLPSVSNVCLFNRKTYKKAEILHIWKIQV